MLFYYSPPIRNKRRKRGEEESDGRGRENSYNCTVYLYSALKSITEFYLNYYT